MRPSLLQTASLLVTICALQSAACKQRPQNASLGSEEPGDERQTQEPGASADSLDPAHDDIVRILGAYQSNRPSKPLAPVTMPEEFTARLMQTEKVFQDVLISSFEGFDPKIGFALAGASADLRTYDTPVKDQKKRSTCSAFASIATLENTLMQKGESHDLSEEAFWSQYPADKRDKAPQKVLSTYSVPSEADWPYDGIDLGGPGVARVEFVRSIKGSEVVAALEAGRPIYTILVTNRSWDKPKYGVIDNYEAAIDGEHSAHAVAIVAATTDYLVFKNSWGATWGDGGYGYLSYDYCSSWYCAFWEVGPAVLANGGGGRGGGGGQGFAAFFDKTFTSNGGRRLTFRREQKAEYINAENALKYAKWTYRGNVIDLEWPNGTWVFRIIDNCHLEYTMPDGRVAKYTCEP